MHKLILLMFCLAAMASAATIRWVGGATATAQVDHCTPTNVEVGDIFTITATGENGDTEAVSFVATAATVQNVAEGLAAAWNARTHYLYTPITASEDDTKTILTADTAGVPFYVAASASDGGGTDDQTHTRSSSVANSGPYDWNTALNWDGGAVPGAAGSQDVYVDGGTILYGLDQSGIANTLDELHIVDSQLGANPSGGRNAGYLQIKATDVHIGEHWGPGSLSQTTPVMVDTGSTASTITIYASGTNTTTTLPAIWVKANSGSSKLITYGGYVGVCYDKASTAQFGNVYNYGGSIYSGDGLTIQSSYEQTTGTAKLHLASPLGTFNLHGGTCTLYGYGYGITTASVYDGTLYCYSPVTTFNEYDGTTTIYTDSGDGSIGTANVKGGTLYYKGSAGITTLDIYAGTVDCRGGTTSRTITTLRMDPGATFIYSSADITLTNKIAPKTSSQEIKVEYSAP